MWWKVRWWVGSVLPFEEIEMLMSKEVPADGEAACSSQPAVSSQPDDAVEDATLGVSSSIMSDSAPWLSVAPSLLTSFCANGTSLLP